LSQCRSAQTKVRKTLPAGLSPKLLALADEQTEGDEEFITLLAGVVVACANCESSCAQCLDYGQGDLAERSSSSVMHIP
jgi:hypothetical protein